MFSQNLFIAVFIGFLSISLSFPSRAVQNKETPAFSESPAVQEFIAEMQHRHGFDAMYLARQFAMIRSNSNVLRAIQPAPVSGTQRSWHAYRTRFLNERRINRGLRFWREHSVTLVRAEAMYGVPREIIAAIIGVETEYGLNTGRFGVFEALATLAFDYPPRASFFRDELEHFLLMAKEDGAALSDYRGSYAGAMGIPQFMPSSRRSYAVDFDGDNRVDLYHSAADAIGSVACFLSLHGWQPGGPVALPASIGDKEIPPVATGVKPSLSLKEMRERGVLPFAAGTERLDDMPAALIDFVSPGQPTEYWIGFDNFYVITRYNRSSFYAMSVLLLAESLKGAWNTETMNVQ